MSMLSLATVLSLSLLCLVEANGNLVEPQHHAFKAHDVAHVQGPAWPAVDRGATEKSANFVNASFPQVYDAKSADTLDEMTRNAVGVRYRDPKKLRKSDSCKYCTSSKCQSIDKISRRNSYCFDVKGRLSEIKAKDIAAKGKKRSGYSNALMMTCFQNYCKTFRAHEFCGLKPPGSNVKSGAVIAQMKKEEAELKELTKRFRREVVPRFKHADYMKRRKAVLKHREDAKKTRDLALNARSDNFRLKKQLKSTKHRKNVFNMHKWGNETTIYARYQSYWNRLNESLFFAVRTSPLSVEKVKKQVRKEYSELVRDRAMVRKLRSDVTSMEAKHRLYVEEKEFLEEKVSLLEKSVEAGHNDVKLFRKVGGDVRDVLLRIIKDVKSRKIKVACGPDALANAIAEYTT